MAKIFAGTPKSTKNFNLENLSYSVVFMLYIKTKYVQTIVIF